MSSLHNGEAINCLLLQNGLTNARGELSVKELIILASHLGCLHIREVIYSFGLHSVNEMQRVKEVLSWVKSPSNEVLT